MPKKVKKTNNLTFNHPDTRNAFNTLVANIRFASIDDAIKTFTITAPGENEGKSTVSSNLALSLANSGKRVLLVDADMRRRSLGNAIGVHPKYGIYAALSGRCAVNEAISQTHHKNLFFLDCEPNIPDPAVVISTNTFAKFVDFLHDIFDYVIFDTPPLSTFVDGAMIAALTDATILVVRQNFTKKVGMENTVNQLEHANANVIGTVMTFSDEAADSQYYYAYYNPEGKRVKKKDHAKLDDVSDAQIASNLATWANPKKEGNAAKRQKRLSVNSTSDSPSDTTRGRRAFKRSKSHANDGSPAQSTKFNFGHGAHSQDADNNGMTNKMDPIK